MLTFPGLLFLGDTGGLWFADGTNNGESRLRFVANSTDIRNRFLADVRYAWDDNDCSNLETGSDLADPRGRGGVEPVVPAVGPFVWPSGVNQVEALGDMLLVMSWTCIRKSCVKVDLWGSVTASVCLGR